MLKKLDVSIPYRYLINKPLIRRYRRRKKKFQSLIGT